MSDTDILAALDSWLDGYSQAATEMPVVTKPINQVSTVTKVVTTETLPDKAVTRITPVTPKIINSESANETPARFIDVTSVTSKKRSSRVLSEIEEVKNWMIRTGRPQEDYLFRLIMEKCENDSEARQHFLEYSRTRKAQNDEAGEPAARVMDLNFSPVSVKTQDIGDWENLINWWLDHIEERDPDLRNTCLNQCRRNAEARRYFLSHAILEFRKSKRESND